MYAPSPQVFTRSKERGISALSFGFISRMSVSEKEISPSTSYLYLKVYSLKFVKS